MKNTVKSILATVAAPVLSKIHRYKDIHKGESCYLIGDGVSVKWFELSAFTDKIAMPCGFLPFHRDFDRLNAPYLMLIEPFWFFPSNSTTTPPIRKIKNHIQSLYKNQVIDRYSEREFFINLSNFPVLRRKNITYIFRDLYDERLPHDFISNRVNAFTGSLRFSILLATYMGFDHIYLVGYDYTHVPSRSLHWYERGIGIVGNNENYNESFFKIVKEFTDITTITLDGSSDVIESVTYEKFTGREPVFKENTEILDEKYLKILATWPGYTIF